MTPKRHGSTVIELPNDLEVLITREFEAPIALVFDVLTKTGAREQMVPGTRGRDQGMLDRPARRRELPLRLRDRGRHRDVVSGNLLGGRAADPDRPDVAVRRASTYGRRSSRSICTKLTE
jgi:hypothetical protein